MQLKRSLLPHWATAVFALGISWVNITAPTAAAPNWQYVGTADEYQYYIDMNSLTNQDYHRLLWLHVVFPKVQPNGGTSATHYISVNCQKRTMNIYQSILYNSDNQEISKREQEPGGTAINVNGSPPGWGLICK